MRTRYYRETTGTKAGATVISMDGVEYHYWKLSSKGIFIRIDKAHVKSFKTDPKRNHRMYGNWYLIPVSNWFRKFKKKNGVPIVDYHETPRIFTKKYHKDFKEITEQEAFCEVL